MLRTCMVVGMCLLACSAGAQPVFVAGSIGANTILTPSYEYGGIETDGDRPTAVTFGGTVGIHLGSRWGVALDVTQSLETETRSQPDVIPLAGVVAVEALYPYFVGIETRERHTIIGPSAWVSHTVNSRLDLVFLGGMAFTRHVTEQEFDLPIVLTSLSQVAAGRGLSPGGTSLDLISIVPQSYRVVQYDVQPLVGVDGRIRMGTHLYVNPGFRMQAGGGTWSIRPSVGVGWLF